MILNKSIDEQPKKQENKKIHYLDLTSFVIYDLCTIIFSLVNILKPNKLEDKQHKIMYLINQQMIIWILNLLEN